MSLRNRQKIAVNADPTGSSIPPLVRRIEFNHTKKFAQLPPRRKRTWLWQLFFLLLIIPCLFLPLYFFADYLRRPSTLGISPNPIFSLAEPTLEIDDFQTKAEVQHELGRNETLKSVALRFGFEAEQITAIEQSIDKLRLTNPAVNLPQAGRTISFLLDNSGSIEKFLSFPTPGFELLSVKDEQGRFHSLIRPLESPSREHVVVGTVESSFAAAATKAGVEYALIDDLVDLFSDRVEFNKDFQKGDRFTMIYRDETLSDGRRTGPGQILAAALEINSEHLVAARYVGSDGKARYFNEQGKLLGNSFLRYPLKFSRISSYFSNSRFHPILRRARAHNGVDFAAPVGTPVRSVADGKISFAGRKGGNGIMLKIDHSKRYSTAYLHLSSIAKGLRTGVSVKRGQLIGAVGMTGLATGPHLHYSFYDNGKYTDPLKIKLPMLESLEAGTNIHREYLRRVLQTLTHYQTVDLKPFFLEKN